MVASVAKSRSELSVVLLVVNIGLIVWALGFDIQTGRKMVAAQQRTDQYEKGVKETVFSEVVLNPVPTSVKNIEMKGSYYSSLDKFRMTFDISQEDLPKILSRRAYEKLSIGNPLLKGWSIYRYSEKIGLGKTSYVISVNGEQSKVIFDQVHE